MNYQNYSNMFGDLSHIPSSEISQLMHDDASFIKFANDGRKSLSGYPTQSHFRVYAIFVIEKEDGTLCLIHGANQESGYIGGSICAERATLCLLRFIPNPIIREVVIVTDSDTATSPGVLCREFLSSHAKPDTLIVLGNAEGSIVTRVLLSQLWPHPFQYRYKDRNNVVAFAKECAAKVATFPNNDNSSHVHNLFSSALTMNSFDKMDALHPLRFSAALLFDDNTIETAWMLKGLEYGCTLDPVSQLVRDIERRRYCSPCCPGSASFSSSPTTKSTVVNIHQTGLASKPVMIVMCDQFGVAHAPFAQARCLLSEHGYDYVKVLVHSSEGELCTVNVAELIPQPDGTRLVSCDIFH